MSFSEWEEVRLGEILDISSSKRIYSKEYSDSGVPFYRSKEIIEKSKGENVSTDLFISKERFNEIVNKFGAPKKGDILLTSVGTLGVPYVVKDEIFYFKDGNLTWLKNYSDSCHNKFIYYWLISDYGKNQINSRCIGSTQKALTIETLKKFNIKLPDIKEQKAIAHILSTLDEKIEVNNQINKTLETMAQAIFKQWFVDFEFPNEDGEPYRSSGGEMVESELGLIPKGWEVRRVGDIIDVNTDSYSSKDDWKIINYLDTGNITNNRIEEMLHLNVDLDKIPSRAKRKVRHNDIVFSTVRPNQKHYGLIKEPLHNMLVSTGFVVIRCKQQCLLSNEFLYLWLTQKEIIEYLQGIGETSTSTYPSIKASHIEELKIVVPKKEITKKISGSFVTAYENINALQKQNRVLQKIRDNLLPRIMSGEMRVKPF